MRSAVKDVMTRTVAVVGEDADFKEIVDKMHEHRVSALPVIDDNDELLGIVSETDLVMKEEHPELGPEPRALELPTHRARRRKASARTAYDLMTAPAQTIAPQAALTEAAKELHECGVHQLVVVDDSDHVVGILTGRDLLKVFLRSDADIDEEIEEILEVTLSVPRHDVRVRVRRGVVSLEGELEHRDLVALLVGLTQRVDGVVSVESRLSARERDVREPSELVAPWTTLPR